jgi:hypothetical protein
MLLGSKYELVDLKLQDVIKIYKNANVATAITDGRYYQFELTNRKEFQNETRYRW